MATPSVWTVTFFVITLSAVRAQHIPGVEIPENVEFDSITFRNTIKVNASYGEMASLVLPPSFQVLANAVIVFNVTTQPAEAKDLRRFLTDTRGYHDLFSYAYPNDTFGRDLWLDIRATLNRGHFHVGEFKDLFDSKVNFTEHELSKRRDKVLNWRIDFLAQYPLIARFVREPASDRLFVRPKDILSTKFYWGTVSVIPSLQFTAIQNFAALENETLTHIVNDYIAARNLTIQQIFESKDVNCLHDFRKKLRGINLTQKFFPLIWGNHATDPLMSLISDLQARLGDIMDTVNLYHWCLSHNDMAKAAEVESLATANWKSLVQWMDERQFQVIFAKLRDFLALPNNPSISLTV